jgi:hypothetical protein
MPRVHQMRTDLSQYYHSTKPSVRLNYISSEAEKVNFTINGTELLMRDFNIFCTTKTNHRAILDNLKQLALTNNTTGASIYDLGNLIKADSIAEVSKILKDAEDKQTAQRQQDMQQQQEMQQQQIQAQAQEKSKEREFESQKQDKDIKKDLMVAEIRASGFGAMQDIDQNQQSDFRDAMQDIQKREEYQDSMNFKREEASRRNTLDNSKLDIERERMSTQKEIANTQLEIARENKNKYDVKSKSEKSEKKKKKK